MAAGASGAAERHRLHMPIDAARGKDLRADLHMRTGMKPRKLANDEDIVRFLYCKFGRLVV